VAWVLTRGLTTVRNEFNAVFPGRDKASDGSVGDLAHQTSSSGHNPDRTGRAEYKDGDSLDEVRAIDVDRDLVRGSGTDWMELVVQYLVRKARAGGYIPFRYIIYKRRIWSRTDGWKTRTYTGANKHDKHAHFSGDYTQTADNWTGSLGLASVRGSTGGSSMAIEDADLVQIRTHVALGLYDALWVAANGRDLPDGRLKFSGPGSVGSAIKSNLAKLTADPAVAGVVTALAALDEVDEVALAEALAPAVAALVTPALVAAVEANDGEALTEVQVTEAVKAAFRQGSGD
jgi:hypothetical protein